LLAIVELARDLDENLHELIAGAMRTEVGKAFALELEDLAMLRAGGHIQLFAAFECRDFDFATQRSMREGDRNLADQIVIVPRENRMRLNRNIASQIARWRARLAGFSLAGDGD